MRARHTITERVILSLLMLVLIPGIASAAQWAMHRHDAQHTNHSPYIGPTKVGMKWQFDNAGSLSSGAAIADDGTIYLLADSGSTLVALSPDGVVLNSVAIGYGCCPQPILGPDGTIYVSGGHMMAFNPDLTLKWENAAYGGLCCGSLSLGPDGSLYVVEGSVDVLDSATGNLKWSFEMPGEFATYAPAVSANGDTAYITTQISIYAVSATDGSVEWSHSIDNPGCGSAVVSNDGRIYVPNGSGILAIHKKGPSKSADQINVGSGSEIVFDIAIAPDGTIASVTYDTVIAYGTWQGANYIREATGATLYKLNKNGTIYWSAGINAYAEPWATQTYTPIIDALGNIYIYTRNYDSVNNNYPNQLYGFSLNGDLMFMEQLMTTGSMSQGPVRLAMGADGTLYASAYGAPTYALGPAAAWPMYHGDAQHTNRSAYSGPTQITQLWRAMMNPSSHPGSENYTQTGTAIGADGTIYVGGADTNLYAFNPDGTIKAVFDGSAAGLASAGICCGAPIIGPDGTIYVSGRYTWALNPDDLSIKWTSTRYGLCCGSMTLGPDGTLYLGEWGRGVVAMDASTGVEKWQFSDPWGANDETTTHSPAISHDGGTAYITTQYHVFAVNVNVVDTYGEPLVLWSYAIQNPGFAAAAVGADGLVYVPNGNAVTSLNPDGSLALNRDVGTNVFEVALDTNGDIALVTFDSVDVSDGTSAYTAYEGIAENATGASLYLLKTDGTGWARPMLGNVQPNWMTQFAPVIDASGNVYVVTRDYDLNVGGTSYNYLYGFDAAGNELFFHPLDDVSPDWSFEGPTQLTIGSDGTLYVSWFNGYLYAFGQALP